MLEKKDLETIEKVAKEFFEKTSFAAEVFVPGEKDGVVLIEVKTDSPQILIGEGGQTLVEIQRLLKLILKKHIQELFYLDIDINNYKKQKKEYLREMARSAADEVSLFKKEKILPQMPAFDRRVIHTELAERSDVVSESTGEEPDRRIVIKPRP